MWILARQTIRIKELGASLTASGWFARWNKPRWGLLLLLVFPGNVLVATIAWIIVRLIH
jgi:hypothetical protein